jgi:serine/threonine protein kinase
MITQIGRYQVIGELGKGAMGVVYKATDPNIGRVVALKTMRLDLEGMEAQESLARFRNEARAAGVLNHRNIITIYDAGEHENLFYIAMEIIEGDTLQQKLKQHELSVEEIVSVATQVCAGLDYAHSKGVIHRDIKPANIMIEPDGTAKIMDFGIAKAGTNLTTTGQVVGTPNYMSPEQVRGKRLDGRSDLFSLGVVLYEMITGERPFAGANVTTIVYKIVNEQPAEPHALDATVHPGLSAVVMKALAKPPDLRYQSGAEMARDLHNFKTLGAATSAAASAPSPSVSAAAPAATHAPASSAGIPATPPAPPVAAASPAPAAVPTSLPSLESTVARPHPERPAAAPKARSSIPMLAVGIAVLLLAIVGGGYFLKARRGAGEAPLPPSATQPTTSQPAGEQPPEQVASAEAPSPVPPPPTTGELQVDSSPQGATVRLDGHTAAAWVTPFLAPKLKPGSHSVVFSKTGYQPVTLKIEVEAGKRAGVSAELKLMPATFAVSSKPPGASILLDGKPTGQVTPAQITVAPGQHQVDLALEGYLPATIAAEAGAGQTLRIAPALQSQGARPFSRLKRLFGSGEERSVLEIQTRPKGAEVWIGDSKAPDKTPATIPLKLGAYHITLRLPGFKPVTRNVTIEKGKSYGINQILVRE